MLLGGLTVENDHEETSMDALYVFQAHGGAVDQGGSSADKGCYTDP